MAIAHGARDDLAVGLTIDKQHATERLGRALVLARSEEVLPAVWLERATTVSQAKNKTFTAMLGTALLARASDDDVDVRSLREDESACGYSARSLAKEVLVPCCVRAGIDLRVRGAEPLNNQPFLRAARVSTALKVTKPAVPELEYLCECLDAIEALKGKAGLEALAAFLRVRIAASGAPAPVEIGSGLLGLTELLAAADVASMDGESGAALLGLVAAGARLLFKDVKVRRPGDSTHTWQGHIGVFDQRVQTLAIETSQKALSESDALLFAGRLAEAGVRRGLIVTTESWESAAEQLTFQARRLHGVELTFFFQASEFVRLAMLMAIDDLPLSLAAFPRLALQEMHAAGVPVAQMEAWSAAFSRTKDEAP